MASSCRLIAIPQHLLAAVVVVAVVGGMLAVSSGADICPDDDAELVYPYWSNCGNGASYGESYYLVYYNQSEGGLVGEWDESNQTYYMRLTGSSGDDGSLFTLLPLDSEQTGTSIRNNDTLRIVLSTLDYALNWRNESVDEWFLVQESCSSESCASDGASFIINQYTDVTLACPRSLRARCYAYYFSSAPGTYEAGLQRYEEDGVAYVTLGKAGSQGDLPFLLMGSTAERRGVA